MSADLLSNPFLHAMTRCLEPAAISDVASHGSAVAVGRCQAIVLPARHYQFCESPVCQPHDSGDKPRAAGKVTASSMACGPDRFAQALLGADSSRGVGERGEGEGEAETERDRASYALKLRAQPWLFQFRTKAAAPAQRCATAHRFPQHPSEEAGSKPSGSSGAVS